MPVWHEATRAARESGELVLVGVIQEQHAERCQLYAQWQGLNWTILQDPINRLGNRAVPIFIALDESGVVVDTSMRVSKLADFLARPAPVGELAASQTVQDSPPVPSLKQSGDAAARADHALLWGEETRIAQAIEDYLEAIRSAAQAKGQSVSAEGRLRSNQEIGSLYFRLGVAYRKRYDSNRREQGDFQRAVDAWNKALMLDPNHYIYRRRIQQYGPRLDKPYPFYDWISNAQQELIAKGATPVSLKVPLAGAEIAHPQTRRGGETDHPGADASNATAYKLDPQGKIKRDMTLVRADAVVVPGKVDAGAAMRVHLRFTLAKGVHWNNEADPMLVWFDVPKSAGWKIEKPLWTLKQPPEVESVEERSIDFEVNAQGSVSDTTLRGYALYYVCEESGGTCLFLRKDLEIPIQIAATLPTSEPAN